MWDSKFSQRFWLNLKSTETFDWNKNKKKKKTAWSWGRKHIYILKRRQLRCQSTSAKSQSIRSSNSQNDVPCRKATRIVIKRQLFQNFRQFLVFCTVNQLFGLISIKTDKVYYIKTLKIYTHTSIGKRYKKVCGQITELLLYFTLLVVTHHNQCQPQCLLAQPVFKELQVAKSL